MLPLACAEPEPAEEALLDPALEPGPIAADAEPDTPTVLPTFPATAPDPFATPPEAVALPVFVASPVPAAAEDGAPWLRPALPATPATPLPTPYAPLAAPALPAAAGAPAAYEVPARCTMLSTEAPVMIAAFRAARARAFGRRCRVNAGADAEDSSGTPSEVDD